MTSPFAEYELTSLPWPELRTSMAVGSRLVLDPAHAMRVSRRQGGTIWIEGSPRLFEQGWLGTENHSIACYEGIWHFNDNNNGARLNGKRRALDDDHHQPLSTNDRIEPAKGLVFTFFQRDDLEPIAAQLADHPDVLDQISRGLGWGSGDQRVLIDWILERGQLTRDDAHRAIQHFRYRIAHSGTL